MSTTMGSPDPMKDGQLLPPEVAGMRVAMRAAWPLIVAVAGSLPVLAARASNNAGQSPYQGAVAAVCGVTLLVLMVVAWVRFRERARAWWARTLEEGQSATKAKQVGRL